MPLQISPIASSFTCRLAALLVLPSRWPVGRVLSHQASENMSSRTLNFINIARSNIQKQDLNLPVRKVEACPSIWGDKEAPSSSCFWLPSVTIPAFQFIMTRSLYWNEQRNCRGFSWAESIRQSARWIALSSCSPGKNLHILELPPAMPWARAWNCFLATED